jgi:hypothetical protein
MTGVTTMRAATEMTGVCAVCCLLFVVCCLLSALHWLLSDIYWGGANAGGDREINEKQEMTSTTSVACHLLPPLHLLLLLPLLPSLHLLWSRQLLLLSMLKQE